MENLNKLVKLAIAEYKNEFGETEMIQEGESFATVFNDCVLVIGKEKDKLKVSLSLGKPYFINESIE